MVLPAALDAFFAISIFVNSVSNQTCVVPVWRECSGTQRTAAGFRPINISGVAAMGIANAAGESDISGYVTMRSFAPISITELRFVTITGSLCRTTRHGVAGCDHTALQ